MRIERIRSREIFYEIPTITKAVSLVMELVSFQVSNMLCSNIINQFRQAKPTMKAVRMTIVDN